MNEVLKCLETRRSVRAYKPEQITNAELEAILNAGLYAPTGMNRQSAIMLVIQDKPLIEKLSKMNAYYMGKDMDAFYGAPTVIAVLADSNIRTHFEDGCLVLGNLMNAAHSLGVDSCWIHRARQTFETEEGKALMKKWGISEDYVGIGNCILGYADGELPPARPRKEDYILKV